MYLFESELPFLPGGASVLVGLEFQVSLPDFMHNNDINNVRPFLYYSSNY